MANQQYVAYVRERISSGVSIPEIVQTLQDNNVTDKEIHEIVSPPHGCLKDSAIHRTQSIKEEEDKFK